MIQLHTLGRLELTASDGRELRSVLLHPKRAALVVYLAAACPRGWQRRDVLLALLWPELDQEHARAALRKAVHHVRRALGEQALEGRGDEELRLVDTAVWSDVAAFDAALDADDPESAVALYQGGFLDGFFVADAPEFERWIDTRRSQLHRRAFLAAWTVAERAEQRGNAFEAAHWARRAAAIAVDDEASLRRLMLLLERIGDRAGAMQTYEEFARRINAELDLEPSAESQALARRIRNAPTSAPSLVEADRVPAQPDIVAAPAATPMTPREPLPRRSREVPSRGARRWVPLALVAVLLAGLGTWRASNARAPGAGTDVVAVFPFAVRGGGPDLAYLSDGFASLVSTAIDGAGEIRSIDSRVLVGAVVDHQGPHGMTLERAGRTAESLGAGRFVLGNLVHAGGQLRIDATLYEGVNAARSVAVASAEGPVDSIFSLADQVTARLIAAQRGDAARSVPRLAALTTRSIPALKAYLDGERDFRLGRFVQSVAGFQRALSLDSGFALAQYRLASAYTWGGNEDEGLATARAARLATRLAPAERELIEAFVRSHLGEADDAERRYREILRQRPEELDALYMLGETLFHFNPKRGRRVGEAKPYFERARVLNHGDAPLIHLLEIAAIERDRIAFDTLWRSVKTESHFWLAGTLVKGMASGNAAARAAALNELRRAGDSELAAAASHALYLIEDAASGEAALLLMTDAARPPELRLLGHLLLAHLHVGSGRLRDAARALDAAAAIDSLRSAEHAGLLHAIPFIPVSAARLAEIRVALSTGPRGPTLHPSSVLKTDDEARHEVLRRYSLALIDARLGARRQARDAAAAIEQSGGDTTPPQTTALSAGVRAQLTLGEGNAHQALAALERAAPTLPGRTMIVFSPFLGLRHERYLRAEALARVGRSAEALAYFRSFEEHSSFGRIYLAPASYRQGELLERVGRNADAARAYRRFANLWRHADAELQPLVREARRRASR